MKTYYQHNSIIFMPEAEDIREIGEFLKELNTPIKRVKLFPLYVMIMAPALFFMSYDLKYGVGAFLITLFFAYLEK